MGILWSTFSKLRLIQLSHSPPTYSCFWTFCFLLSLIFSLQSVGRKLHLHINTLGNIVPCDLPTAREPSACSLKPNSLLCRNQHLFFFFHFVVSFSTKSQGCTHLSLTLHIHICVEHHVLWGHIPRFLLLISFACCDSSMITGCANFLGYTFRAFSISATFPGSTDYWLGICQWKIYIYIYRCSVNADKLVL